MITAKEIQRAFRDAGAHMPNPKTASKIAQALPLGALATGDSERDVLEIIIANRGSGAVERLLTMKRDYDLEQRRKARLRDRRPMVR